MQHLAHTGRCGSCKTPLPAQREPLAVGAELFDAVVSQASEPVLVDFWANWCGPCHAAAPDFERLAREMAGEAILLKVEIDAERQLAARFRISSVPFFLIFLNGNAVAEQRGWPGRAVMARKLAALRHQAASA